MLAVVVRELSKHQCAFCLIVAFVIARFTSLSCYSSAKTSIRLVKLYQINESFCSITHCTSLCLVYCLIAVLTCFQCPELKVSPLSLLRYFYFKPEPKPKPTLELHFLNFSIAFSHRVSVHDITVLPFTL